MCRKVLIALLNLIFVVSVSSSFADLPSRLRQILMYNSNPEVVKLQEKEKQEKKLEKERNVVALYAPKKMNPLIEKKAEILQTMNECTDSKSIISVFRLTCSLHEIVLQQTGPSCLLLILTK